MHKRCRVWWLLLLIPILLGAGYVAWVRVQHQPMPEALAALASDAEVEVETGRWLLFRPAGRTPRSGLILYPGGFVDPRAYAPTARAIAAKGYQVVVVPMPLNLAVLGSNRAANVVAAYPEIARWAIGGHSLGGAMAARYAYRSPQRVHGLVLWAAYPASGDDLSARALAVASIYGTLDGLATPAKIDASRPLLPPDTQWTAIEGGNHAQVGWYGPQSGDLPATLSRADQQAQIVLATVGLLEQVND
jgi:pimeloyl-ACP methyl ester carboxylesterase